MAELTEKICLNCGKTFLTPRLYQKHCSDKCRRAYQNERARLAKLEKKKRMKPKETTLTQDAIEARKRGLTYGQYMLQKTSSQ